MDRKHVVSVRVEGAYACFTRPDLKVERMSYPCMTPSAARGILDAIFWKPEFKWHVLNVKVLKPISFVSIKRNEIKSKQGKTPIVIEDARTQRTSAVLRDVAYIIEARVHTDAYSEQNPPQKYVEIFNRRVKKGQCFRQPFLGTREFSCEFMPVTGDETPIPGIHPIGPMLLDMYYDETGNPSPRFFYDAKIENGVLDCAKAYEEMLTSAHVRPRNAEEGKRSEEEDV